MNAYAMFLHKKNWNWYYICAMSGLCSANLSLFTMEGKMYWYGHNVRWVLSHMQMVRIIVGTLTGMWKCHGSLAYLPVLVFRRMENYMFAGLLLIDKHFLIDTGNDDITLPCVTLWFDWSQHEMGSVYFLRCMIHSFSSDFTQSALSVD